MSFESDRDAPSESMISINIAAEPNTDNSAFIERK
jgi:hypothetical protein